LFHCRRGLQTRIKYSRRTHLAVIGLIGITEVCLGITLRRVFLVYSA
jgi:hypothetical protein